MDRVEPLDFQFSYWVESSTGAKVMQGSVALLDQALLTAASFTSIELVRDDSVVSAEP